MSHHKNFPIFTKTKNPKIQKDRQIDSFWILKFFTVKKIPLHQKYMKRIGV